MVIIKDNTETSFWGFISNISKIEIPKLQRDYAQGRSSDKAKKIRLNFLNKLIEVVDSENNSVELDFIYGNIDNDVFQPLDGQQRLTTLFLMHWYIALKTNNLQINQNIFARFTYETRISSREFCENLVKRGENLGDGITINDKISDAEWFFLSWKQDPTIKAMLTMLDTIEELLEERDLKIYWKKLTSNKSPITFHFKELDNIGLTDDLYIKMNARGKPLTDFENFKATFEKYIEKNKWEEGEKCLINTFSHKIDTVWMDLFWKHRGLNNKTDIKIMKFISGIAINYYAQAQDAYIKEEDKEHIREVLEEKSKGKVTDESVKRKFIEDRIASLFNNSLEVCPEDFPTREAFKYLMNCFDIYSKEKSDEIRPVELVMWSIIDDKMININKNTELQNNLFIELVKDARTEYKQRVLFYAQTQYLELNNDFTESFSEWMRVVRNIVQNSTIDSAATFISAVNLINELALGCGNIYEFLSNAEVKSNFASKQVLEEIKKSSIIMHISDSKGMIFSTEDTNFFKGRIEFALYCIDYENVNSSYDGEKLGSLYKVICEHLNSGDITNQFRSALLTIKDNKYYEYWWSWSYGTDSVKRCLIENTSDLINSFANGDYKDYLKDLLLILAEKSLNNIIDEYVHPQEMPNWKLRLIKDSQLLNNYCQSHYIGIPNDNQCCFLFRHKKRPSSRDECVKIE